MVSSFEVKTAKNNEAGQCTVRIHYAGGSSDIFRAFEGWAYHYPLVMGRELSGVVEEVGSNVSKFNVKEQSCDLSAAALFSMRSMCKYNFVRCKSTVTMGLARMVALSLY